MWEMLCERVTDLSIEFKNVQADDEYGTCDWKASYTFTKTGRKVINNVRAHMRFKDGTIIEHTDQFKLSSWCKQALGWSGSLFGSMSWLQRKVRRSAQKNLYDYIVANQQLKIIFSYKTVSMTSRRKFLYASFLSSVTMLLNKKNFASTIELNEPLLKVILLLFRPGMQGWKQIKLPGKF